jgi:hypothetical protein
MVTSHAAAPAAITGNGLPSCCRRSRHPRGHRSRHRRPHRIAGTPTHGYEPPGRNGGIRQELVAGVSSREVRFRGKPENLRSL